MDAGLLWCALLLLPGVVGFRYKERVYQPYPEARKAPKQRVQCYQCAFSPAKTVYKTIKYPVEVKDYFSRYHGYSKKVVYRTKMIPLRRSGGWDKCMGPFNPYQAKAYGLDVWECDNRCYIRVDRNGNVFRGCYKGEFGVDPNKLGCRRQAGQLYCFCRGDKCNYAAAPSFERRRDH